MERPEIVELFYSAIISPNDVEQLFEFLRPRVEWILSAADPRTLGEELRGWFSGHKQLLGS